MSDVRPAIAEHLRFYAELGVDGVSQRSRVGGARPTSVEQPRVRPSLATLRSRPTSTSSATPRSCWRPLTTARPSADCTRCKLHTLGRKQVVFGVGNPDADLMFVGEAPGADEDIQGMPFVGRAGQLLTKMIEAIGLRRDDVYIANVIKCRPPGNRNPEPDEIAHCEPFLFQQIDGDQAESDRRARVVRGEDAAAQRRIDFAAARPGLRLPRRQADPDVPSVVPAAQPRPEARRVGGPEEGARAPDRPCHGRLVGSPRALVRVAVPVPALGPLTYSRSRRYARSAVGARVLVPLGKRMITGWCYSSPLPAPSFRLPASRFPQTAPSFQLPAPRSPRSRP